VCFCVFGFLGIGMAQEKKKILFLEAGLTENYLLVGG